MLFPTHSFWCKMVKSRTFVSNMFQRFVRLTKPLTILILFGFGAVTLTFYIVGLRDELAEDRLLPGGEKLPPPEPFGSRYCRWLCTVFGTGFSDFGQSNKIVVKNVLTGGTGRLQVTATIGFLSWFLGWGLGLAVAILLATRYRLLARFYQENVYPFLQAVPSLIVVIGFYIILLYLEPDSSRSLRILFGVSSLVVLIVPATTALWFDSIDRVLNREYIRVARAKGISPKALWCDHILPNVFVSSGILNQAVFSLAGLVVGSAFVEGVFRLGGVAESFIEGTHSGHAELCAFATLLYFGVTALGAFLAEVIVIYLDPDREAYCEDNAY